MLSHDDVRRLALSLPGSYEQDSYGDRPSWRTKARMFAWIREDPEALVVWVESVEDKEALIASEPHKAIRSSSCASKPSTPRKPAS